MHTEAEEQEELAALRQRPQALAGASAGRARLAGGPALRRAALPAQRGTPPPAPQGHRCSAPSAWSPAHAWVWLFEGAGEARSTAACREGCPAPGGGRACRHVRPAGCLYECKHRLPVRTLHSAAPRTCLENRLGHQQLAAAGRPQLGQPHFHQRRRSKGAAAGGHPRRRRAGAVRRVGAGVRVALGGVQPRVELINEVELALPTAPSRRRAGQGREKVVHGCLRLLQSGRLWL